MTTECDRREAKAKLLLECAEKPVKRFVQFDAFDPNQMYACVVDELRNGTPVRIQVEQGTPREQVIASVKGLLKWIKRDKSLVGRLPSPEASVDDDDIPF